MGVIQGCWDVHGAACTLSWVCCREALRRDRDLYSYSRPHTWLSSATRYFGSLHCVAPLFFHCSPSGVCVCGLKVLFYIYIYFFFKVICWNLGEKLKTKKNPLEIMAWHFTNSSSVLCIQHNLLLLICNKIRLINLLPLIIYSQRKNSSLKGDKSWSDACVTHKWSVSTIFNGENALHASI